MKKILLMVVIPILFLGCQSNFKYFDPEKPHRGKKGFLNNYDNTPPQGFWKWQWERRMGPSKPKEDFNPEVVKTDTIFLKENSSRNTLTWMGHSSMLLQLGGQNILLDPMFSERASPVSFAGPKRLSALPFGIDQLPRIDVIAISHSHYDHLDLPTLKQVAKIHKEARFFVPLGVKSLLEGEGIGNVQEFDWWENQQINNLTITFVPVQHWSARGLFDRNQTLWGGWHIQTEPFRFLYAGDTGYSKDFLDIKERLGPVDFAAIPIGAYEPRWFMKRQHTNPQEAILIHKDLSSKRSIGVHWGTFQMGDEAMWAPARDLEIAKEELKILENEFKVLKHGETIEL